MYLIVCFIYSNYALGHAVLTIGSVPCVCAVVWCDASSIGHLGARRPASFVIGMADANQGSSSNLSRAMEESRANVLGVSNRVEHEAFFNLSDHLSKLQSLNALLAARAFAAGKNENSGQGDAGENDTGIRQLSSDTLGHLEPPQTVHLETSCESSSFPYVDYTQQGAVRNLFVVIYAIVIVLSVTGNLMVIWTVWRKKHMRTVTNYYIVNLAVSDFLVALFVVPLKLLEYTAPCSWNVFTNDALCSALSFVLPVFVFTSVLTLVAISLER